MIESSSSAHAFVDDGRRELGPAGRSYAICAVCGRRRIGVSHGRVDPERRRRAHYRPPRQPKPKPQPRRRAADLVEPTPREILELALMLDAVLELPDGLVDWRVLLRSQALRDALPEIPRSSGIRAPEQTMPAPSSSRARSDGAGTSQDAPRATLALVAQPTLIEHAPRSDRSRARALTKSIPDRRVRELCARGIVAGFGLRHAGSGHWILERGAERVTMSGTPAGGRAWSNIRSHARRVGIDVEGL